MALCQSPVLTLSTNWIFKNGLFGSFLGFYWVFSLQCWVAWFRCARPQELTNFLFHVDKPQKTRGGKSYCLAGPESACLEQRFGRSSLFVEMVCSVGKNNFLKKEPICTLLKSCQNGCTVSHGKENHFYYGPKGPCVLGHTTWSLI